MKISINTKVKKHFVIIPIALIFFGFVIFQLIYDWHLYRVNSTNVSSQALITSYLDSAINNLDVLAPVDAATGQVYFPDARLMIVGANQKFSLQQIVYLNNSFSGPLDLQVTSKEIIATAESKLLNAQGINYLKNANVQEAAILKQVPNLQACTRGVQLFYAPQNNGSNFQLQFSKKLNNGDTIYAYTEPTCQSPQLQGLVNQLKNIQSY